MGEGDLRELTLYDSDVESDLDGSDDGQFPPEVPLEATHTVLSLPTAGQHARRPSHPSSLAPVASISGPLPPEIGDDRQSNPSSRGFRAKSTTANRRPKRAGEEKESVVHAMNSERQRFSVHGRS